MDVHIICTNFSLFHFLNRFWIFLATVERQTNHLPDIRSLLLWCFAIIVLLSPDLCQIIVSNCDDDLCYRFSELRDALEKLQLKKKIKK